MTRFIFPQRTFWVRTLLGMLVMFALALAGETTAAARICSLSPPVSAFAPPHSEHFLALIPAGKPTQAERAMHRDVGSPPRPPALHRTRFGHPEVRTWLDPLLPRPIEIRGMLPLPLAPPSTM